MAGGVGMLRLVAALVLLAACAPLELPVDDNKTPGPATAPGGVLAQPVALIRDRQTARQLALNFVTVVEAVEPVAEAVCRERTRGANCDFRIVIDDTPGAPPNAFQTLDESGRPVVAFTLGLIASAQNRDELAFVLGHEAAHHIAGHLARQRAAANVAAEAFRRLAIARGASVDDVRAAQAIGAEVGARRFSREFELEADALGTQITERAGFSALQGAAFFARIPDPGDRFLGTHPPNAERMETVRRTVAGL